MWYMTYYMYRCTHTSGLQEPISLVVVRWLDSEQLTSEISSGADLVKRLGIELLECLTFIFLV